MTKVLILLLCYCAVGSALKLGLVSSLLNTVSTVLTGTDSTTTTTAATTAAASKTTAAATTAAATTAAATTTTAAATTAAATTSTAATTTAAATTAAATTTAATTTNTTAATTTSTDDSSCDTDEDETLTATTDDETVDTEEAETTDIAEDTDVAEDSEDNADDVDTAEIEVLKPTVISTPEECHRNCTEDGSPRICHYNFVLEHYTTLGLACTLCTPNATNVPVSNCQCVQADGVEKAIITTNRMMPGPSIQVCENDWVVVDVDNHLLAQDVTIHWHGILHHGTQYYDGVPLVTQCPIQSGTTFRYQFRANRGTLFWHSHTGLQKLDGMYGSLVVRQPKSLDPNSYLYDEDLHSHVILLGDWTHELAGERFPGRMVTVTKQIPISMLINGRGQFQDRETGDITDVPLEVFNVTAGQRYRFRMINAFASVCGAQLTVEGHSLTLIAADGEEVEPVVVTDIISFSGERYDFVINANNSVGTYWIQVRALGECEEEQVQQLAILRYEGGPDEPTSPRPAYDDAMVQGVTMNPLDAVCNNTLRTDAICVNQLQNARDIDERIIHNEPDVKIYLPFRFDLWDTAVLFEPNHYYKHLVNGNIAVRTLLDEITYMAAPSPLLSQYNDIDSNTICNGDNTTNCGEYCSCTHVIQVPLNSLVEIVLVDEVQIPNLSHPFHLHGHSFNVIGMGRSPDASVSEINLKHVIDLDLKGLLERHLLDGDFPAAKDTLAVPNNGYAILRFIADNPGFWLFHCHFLYHVALGMELVIQVGTLDDLPAVPDNFPICGDFQSPIAAN